MGPSFHKSLLIFACVLGQVILSVCASPPLLFWLAILAIVATGERNLKRKALFWKTKKPMTCAKNITDGDRPG